jgi:predicted permease
LALAKSSEAYRGFQIRCSTSAKVLLAFGVPLLLFWVVSRNTTWRDGEASLTTIILAVLYVTISFAVSWKLGIKAAKTKMARLRRSSKVPGEHPTE